MGHLLTPDVQQPCCVPVTSSAAAASGEGAGRSRAFSPLSKPQQPETLQLHLAPATLGLTGGWLCVRPEGSGSLAPSEPLASLMI